MLLIERRVSKRKAHEILKHGKVHGKSLTPKQRRYFGYIYGSSYGDDDDMSDFITVVTLLNKRTQEDSEKALLILQQMYALQSAVGLEFSTCIEKTTSTVYPGYRTAYANARRIVICADSMKNNFNNGTHSKTIRYNSQKIQHYTVVFLHEFAHVLDKRGLLMEDATKNDERIADAFAQQFIDKV